MAEQGQFEHYLNGVLVDEPNGWRDFRQVIERDDARRFIGVKYEGQVTFTGSGYQVLYDLKVANFCGLISYQVFQQCGDDYHEAFAANILLTEVEWNLSRCEAAALAADASYGSYIVNNGKIKLRPTATTSKTGTDIAAAEWNPVFMFDPNAIVSDYINAGNTTGQPGAPIMWDWKACMDHCLQYISDGNISGVTSDWYDSLLATYPSVGEVRQMFALTTGNLLRNVPNIGSHDSFQPWQAPEYDFDTLWQNMAKKFDLWSAIEASYDGTYRLRIEPRDYFFGSAAVTHPWVQDLVETTDTAALYGRIEVGSTETIRGAKTDATLPYLLLLGFTEENYHIPIQCNTDQALDLITDFIIDSNVIETVVMADDDGYDGDVFMIEYRTNTISFHGILVAVSFAAKGEYLTPGVAPYFYNPALINAAVVQRYTTLGAVQYITNDTDGFCAYEPAIGTTYGTTAGFGGGEFPVAPEQARFRFDYITPQTPFGRDPGNNYGNGTPQGTPVSTADSRYTFPQQGLYKMSIRQTWQIWENFSNTPWTGGKRIALRIIVERYDSSNVLLETPLDFVGPYISPFIDGNNPYSWAQGYQFVDTPLFNVFANATDYAIVKYQFVYKEAPFYIGTPIWTMSARLAYSNLPGAAGIFAYWKTEYIENLGGTVLPPDLDGARTVLLKYDRHETLSNWRSLTDDPSAGVNVSPDDRHTILAHVRKVSRVVNTGEASWELIAPTTSTFIR